MFLLQMVTLGKGESFFFFRKEESPAASLFSRRQGLGVPIHITMPSILMNMPFISINIYEYTLLVLLKSIILIAY